ncbi:MAG: hypothetical protein IH852_04405 [Bacteroidetes bacterium]|nr:hypothetical protein [Bacteroidota bacterium]
MEKYRKNRILNAFLSIVGFIIIIISLLYSYFQLSNAEDELTKKRIQIDSLNTINDSLNNSVEELKLTQNSILDFLVSVTGERNISILNSSVDWNEIQSEILNLSSGNRKDAILFAVLLAWKNIPFKMGQQKVGIGFDSPRFISYVLSQVGIEIKSSRGEILSESIMRRFEEVDNPLPGDLAFYQGEGSFGFILASTNNSKNIHVGIGTLQKKAPLQIVSLNYIRTSRFPLIGYYRVVYPDENKN